MAASHPPPILGLETAPAATFAISFCSVDLSTGGHHFGIIPLDLNVRDPAPLGTLHNTAPQLDLTTNRKINPLTSMSTACSCPHKPGLLMDSWLGLYPPKSPAAEVMIKPFKGHVKQNKPANIYIIWSQKKKTEKGTDNLLEKK